MAHTVRFAPSARNDLRAIHAFIAKNDSMENAEYVSREIVRAALTLSEFPKRGTYPPELLLKGNSSYRQIFFKPYRILYRIRGKTVYIAVIADDHRNMQELLMRRLAG